MFVTFNQFYVFVACFFFGAIGGTLFTLTLPIIKLVKSKILTAIIDLLIFIILTFLYSLYAYSLCFPSLRAYMIIGVFSGLICYLKSFHIILAKCLKKIYNICILKSKEKTDDRRKKKKANRGGHGGRGIFNSNSFVRNGVSTNLDRQQEAPNQRN